MRFLILALCLVFASANAANVEHEVSKLYRAPSCNPLITELPIFPILAKQNASTKHSSVVLIGKNKWATSAHSIFDGEHTSITIFVGVEKEVQAIPTFVDLRADVAILRGASGDIKPVEPLTYDIQKFEQLWNIGFPSITNNELLSFTGMHVRYNKRGQMVTTALGLNGMSGGATFRCAGEKLEYVGVITALIKDRIDTKVHTDEDGILVKTITYTNSGISLISPLRID